MFHLLTLYLLSTVPSLSSINPPASPKCQKSLYVQRSPDHGNSPEMPCVFRRKIVILGGQGSGKSSLANSFLGWNLGDLDNQGPFYIGHGVEVNNSLNC